MKKYNKFLHTLEACWLCMRFPFLYPRNRFTGRHRTNILGGILWKLRKYSIQEISITGTQEKTDINPHKSYYNNKYLSFLNYRVELDKSNNKLFLWRTEDKNKIEFDLSTLLWGKDKFDILGSSLMFALGGNPIVKIHVKVKDETDTNNYGFRHESIEFIINKRKHFWYKVISWIDSEILDRILFIPTFTELDAMDDGWRKAFGIQICKELKSQLKKEHYLYKYRITQIKEKYGILHWYDAGHSEAIRDIIRKYEELSWNTCIVCGKPATKISSEFDWISPYCDDCYPKEKVVWQEKIDGKWVETKEYEEMLKKIEEEK